MPSVLLWPDGRAGLAEPVSAPARGRVQVGYGEPGGTLAWRAALACDRPYPVMERLGWPYDILWPSFRFFTGVRPYGIAHLQLLNGAGEHDGPTPEPQS